MPAFTRRSLVAPCNFARVEEWILPECAKNHGTSRHARDRRGCLRYVHAKPAYRAGAAIPRHLVDQTAKFAAGRSRSARHDSSLVEYVSQRSSPNRVRWLRPLLDDTAHDVAEHR